MDGNWGTEITSRELKTKLGGSLLNRRDFVKMLHELHASRLEPAHSPRNPLTTASTGRSQALFNHSRLQSFEVFLQKFELPSDSPFSHCTMRFPAKPLPRPGVQPPQSASR